YTTLFRSRHPLGGARRAAGRFHHRRPALWAQPPLRPHPPRAAQCRRGDDRPVHPLFRRRHPRRSRALLPRRRRQPAADFMGADAQRSPEPGRHFLPARHVARPCHRLRRARPQPPRRWPPRRARPETGAEKLMADGNAILVRDLVVRNSDLTAVRGISFTLPAGGRMGLVGESGSGKTLTALALMGLLPMGWHAEGEVLHDGVDLVTQSDKALSKRRG